jgi:REP element-mobilizing transposase RayT
MEDHIHCLYLSNPEKTPIEIMKQIKGSSSHTINQRNIIEEKFSWQTGYASFTCDPSSLERLFNYIKNQKIHHEKRTFQSEYEQFLKHHGL